MKPKITTNAVGRGLRCVKINDDAIGAALTEDTADAVAYWLESAWPDLLVAALASSHVEQPKKKRKVSK